MNYKKYRLYYQRYLSAKDDWKPTSYITKARNFKEAMKRGNKFWIDGEFGIGSIVMIKETQND